MMRTWIGFVVVLAILTAARDAAAIAFDFEDVALGTVYGGGAGNVPGDVVLSTGGVTMSVERFNTGFTTPFNNATVRKDTPSPFSINTTNHLWVSNVNLKFDFTSLDYEVTGVRFFASDSGGVENFDVNGLGRQVVGVLSSLTAYPGFTTIYSSSQRSFEITADATHRIETLLIGGQEFRLDDVTVTTTRLPGDFNLDGVVDAADYTMWRDGLGTTRTLPEYDVWMSHFGVEGGTGASNAVVVPELAHASLIIGWALCMGVTRRRWLLVDKLS